MSHTDGVFMLSLLTIDGEGTLARKSLSHQIVLLKIVPFYYSLRCASHMPFSVGHITLHWWLWGYLLCVSAHYGTLSKLDLFFECRTPVRLRSGRFASKRVMSFQASAAEVSHVLCGHLAKAAGFAQQHWAPLTAAAAGIYCLRRVFNFLR
jgi:hypothetical protein